MPPRKTHAMHGARSLLTVGDVFAGRYRMITRLGGGSEGGIWAADDLILKTPVALKIFPSSVPGARASLIHEVRVARQVTHPSVCRVFDIGEAEGAVFLSMELVQGGDLAALLGRTGRLSSERVAQLAHQLCAGLAAAHARGVFHGDLTPANILIDQNGDARIKNFGVGFTKGATARRTPGASSARSDVCALGGVLYELVTGNPHHAPSHKSQSAELARLAPDINPWLRRAILAATAHDPLARPATVLEMAALLPDITDTSRPISRFSTRSQQGGRISQAITTLVTGLLWWARTIQSEHLGVPHAIHVA